MELDEFFITIKWMREEFIVNHNDISLDDTVGDLKKLLYEKTGVLPGRMKLLGLKFNGKQADDGHALRELKLKQKTKIVMMGSKEDDITIAQSLVNQTQEIIDDFDVPDDCVLPIEQRQEYLSKIAKRVKDYKINILNQPREGKRLLVLDIDYTLFDNQSTAEHISQLMRPYLHEFLTSAYEDYDIVIWSANAMKWIEVKMRELGIASHPHYKVAFYLDDEAMISIYAPVKGLINIKPLGVIWGKFTQYHPGNTIMFDDLRKNFLMNPSNGLCIKPFKKAYKNRNNDTELLKLAKYLKLLAQMDDWSNLDHRNWSKLLKRTEGTGDEEKQ